MSTTTPINPDKRKPRFKSDVVKASEKPLTPAQKQALCVLARAARKHSMDDRADDVFRREETAKTTQDSDFGQVHGLTEATRSHYDEIAGHFLAIAGRTEEAMKHLMKAGRQAQTHVTLMWAISRQLARLTRGGDAAAQRAYGNKISQKMFRCDYDRAENEQLDYFYRELKNTHPAASNPPNDDAATNIPDEAKPF